MIGTKKSINRRLERHIACIESLWDDDTEQPLTVVPLLDLVAKVNGVHFSHFTCNTLEELKFSLGKMPRRANYRILYLAFHGSAGVIELGDKTCVSLEELSEIMGTRFKDWIVHFGTCGTIAAERTRLQKFISSTGVALLIGYKGKTDWVDSAAMDLIVLDWLENRKGWRTVWKRVRRDYRDLIRITGLMVFPKL